MAMMVTEPKDGIDRLTAEDVVRVFLRHNSRMLHTRISLSPSSFPYRNYQPLRLAILPLSS